MMTSTFKQGSPEWFAARKGRVTGSNVGAILGLNPYKTMEDVLREMVRAHHGAEREFQGNVATEYGSFHEEGARIEYEMETGRTVEECGFFVHPEFDWLGASPDGLVLDDGVIEIKCPYGLRDNQNPVFKSAKEQEHYWAQMQIEMACTQRKRCHFFQWSQYGTSLECVEFDGEWVASVLPDLLAFHKLYLKELDNPDHLKPRRKVIESPEARKIIDEIADLDEVMERAKARKKQVMDELVEMCGNVDAEVCGHKLTLVEKAGAVSYAKVVKEHCKDVDLEPYRGKPTTYWKLT